MLASDDGLAFFPSNGGERELSQDCFTTSDLPKKNQILGSRALLRRSAPRIIVHASQPTIELDLGSEESDCMYDKSLVAIRR